MGLFQKGQAPIALKHSKFDLGDCHINLRELSSQELIAYQSKMGDKDTSNLDFIFDLISRCAVDDDGKPLFLDSQDVKANLNIGVSKFVEIQQAILELSGLQPKN